MKFYLNLFFSVSVFASIIPTSSLEINSNELNWMDSLIKDAQIIGLGESAHGVSKYTIARTMLVDKILKDKDYRLIALENGYYSTSQLNDVINKSSETSDYELNKLLKTMNILYQNIEFKEFIKYLWNHNKKNSSKKIALQGMDIWESPWTNRDLILKGRDFVNASSIEAFDKYFKAANESCFVWKANNWQEATALDDYRFFVENLSFDPYKKKKCIASLTYIHRILQNIASKDFNNFMAKIATKVAISYENVIDNRDTNIKAALSKRDATQAYLTQQWQNYYNTKTILIAHNLHISKKQSSILSMYPDSMYSWSNIISTGEHLVGHYGAKYKSICLTGLDIESSRDGQFPVTKKEDSLELRISKNYEMAALNTKSHFLNKKWWMHLESEESYLNPKEQYDYVFFIKKSKASENIKNVQKFFLPYFF